MAKEKDLQMTPKEDIPPAVTVDPTAQVPATYRIFNLPAAQLHNTITQNLSGVKLDQFSLKKYKTPLGGATEWTIDTARGKQKVSTVRGILVFHRSFRNYYVKSYEETGGGVPPDCVSWDNSGIGKGDPGGMCINCKWNEFGSASKGEGKACKERQALFFLRENDLIPCVISCTTGSLKAIQDFFIDISNENRPYYWYELEFSLREVTKRTTYSQLQVKIIRDLTQEEILKVNAYQKLMVPKFSEVQFEQSDIEELD